MQQARKDKVFTAIAGGECGGERRVMVYRMLREALTGRLAWLLIAALVSCHYARAANLLEPFPSSPLPQRVKGRRRAATDRAPGPHPRASWNLFMFFANPKFGVNFFSQTRLPSTQRATRALRKGPDRSKWYVHLPTLQSSLPHRARESKRMISIITIQP